MSCVPLWAFVLLGLIAATARAQQPSAEEVPGPQAVVEHHFPCPKNAFWFQARAAAVPRNGEQDPLVVLTMQPHGMQGTHNYGGIVSTTSEDLGATWTKPTTHPALEVRQAGGKAGHIVVPVDATPQYHPQTNKLLLIGATFHVDPQTMHDVPGGSSDIFYAVFDPVTGEWAPWRTVEFPKSFPWPYKRSGCAQWLVKPDGELLLPFYVGEHNNSIHYATVARCRFDGTTLTYLEHGSEHKLDFGRGLSEPSLAKFQGKYYLTMRNDQGAYLLTSEDGLNFVKLQKWRFDDGEELGSYNTQQHFLTRPEALYLVYTRRGADNNDVIRHRAPLFMAEIDPQTNRVVRATERVVVPKEGNAAMGNFGVANIMKEESWIVVAKRTNIPGEKNVIISRIRWGQPPISPTQ